MFVMIEKLEAAIVRLPELLEQPYVWDSLIVNRRKPHTYRVFTHLKDGLRICLHKFNACDRHEAFFHPHPWPGAFMVMDGEYHMEIGNSLSRLHQPIGVVNFVMRKWAQYEITDPNTWHSVVPQCDTWTIMVNGPEWPDDIKHTRAVTTKGKDLDKMPEHALLNHLEVFNDLVRKYIRRHEVD